MRTQLTDELCTVIANERLSEGLYLMKLSAPTLAHALQPGQFVHMLLPNRPDHVLRRPFSVYKYSALDAVVEILYQVVGEGTSLLARVPSGEEVSVIGPIGNGWRAPEGEGGILLVGGGVGAAPLFAFAQQLAESGRKVRIVLGAQRRQVLVTYEDYCRLGNVEVVAATDDGSFGYAGFCTDPARESLDSAEFNLCACCGPEVLMRIVAGMAAEAGVACQVSLERRMACGVGACLSCVADTRQGKKRVCVDGPVFDATGVVWE